MTQEEKSLLLKDLCCRLPYGVKFGIGSAKLGRYDLTDIDVKKEKVRYSNGLYADLERCKPYLRPMSSMTEEEKRELAEEQKKDEELFLYIIHKSQEGDDSLLGTAIPHYAEDWANKNHFDYRGLIPMGLALGAPEDMYN